MASLSESESCRVIVLYLVEDVESLDIGPHSLPSLLRCTMVPFRK